MNYLIQYAGYAPYYTNWFDEQNYEDGMLAVNLLSDKYYNGKEWLEVEEDSL